MKRQKSLISAVLVALVLALTLVGCQSSEPVDAVPQIVVPAPAPVEQAPAPAPAVEEAPAQEETPAPVIVRQTGSLSFYGYTLTYDAVPGTALVSYPGFITEADIDAFFAYAFPKHADVLAGVYYDVSTPGSLVVTFPEEVTVADATAVVDMLAKDLEAFVNEYLGVDEPVQVVVVKDEPVVAAEPEVEYPYGVSEIVKADGDDTFDLYVVHTNDVHGRIVEGEDPRA